MVYKGNPRFILHNVKFYTQFCVFEFNSGTQFISVSLKNLIRAQCKINKLEVKTMTSNLGKMR